MKEKIRSIPLSLLTLVAVLSGASCTHDGGGASAPVAGPLELKSKDVLGYLAIPSLNRALKEISAIANLFAPGQVTPEKMKAQLGAMLGDPTLENLELEKPLVVLLVKGKQAGAPPAPALVLPVKKKEALEQAVTGMGMKSQFEGGLFMVALSDPEVLGAPATLTGSYREIAGAGISRTARLQLQLGSLMTPLRPMIEQGISQWIQMFQSLAAAANGSTAEQARSTASILEAEARGLLGLLDQCEVAQIDLDLGGQSIGIDKVVSAKPGTALHDFLRQSSRSPSPLTVLPEAERFLAGALRCDSKSMGVLFKQLVDEAAKGPDGAALAESAAMFLELGNWWGGLAAFGMGPGKEVGFTIDYDMEVLDETKFLAAIEKGMGMLAPGGALSQLYSGMGLELTAKLAKAAREHAGVPVHRWNLSLEAKDPKGPLAANLGMLKAFMKDMELAVVKGHGLMSGDPARLDAMIEQAKSGAAKELPLKARKTFGPGRQGYFDYDLIGLLKVVQGLMPQGPESTNMKRDLDKVKARDPMIIAITFGSGSVQAQVNIPLQPFGEMVQK
jgi:hypothetical protein